MASSSFNILYVIAKIASLFGSTNINTLQDEITTLFQNVEIFMLIIAAIFFLMYLWVQLRYSHIEHHFHHEQERHAHEMQRTAHAAPEHERWSGIVALGSSQNEGDWRRAILEADSMLLQVLDEAGFIGADLGEKLTGANASHFATLSQAWEAHKMRNAIAHDGESLKLTQRDAQATLDQYRQVFHEFGYV